MTKVEVMSKEMKNVVAALNKSAAPASRNGDLSGNGEFVIKIENKTMEIYSQNPAVKGKGVIDTSLNRGDTVTFLVSAKILGSITNVLYNDVTTLVIENQQLTIQSGDAKFNLIIGLKDANIPTLDKGNTVFTTSYSEEEWEALKTKLLFAAAPNGAGNPVFQNLSVKKEAGKVSFFISDGHILATTEMNTVGDDSGINTIVNKDVLNVGVKGDVTVSFSPEFTYLETGNMTYSFVTIVSAMPDFARVIPRVNVKASFNKKDAMEALAKVGIVANCEILNGKERITSHGVQVYFAKEKVVLYTENRMLGNVRADILAQVTPLMEGTKITVAFSYLANAIKACSDGVCSILGDVQTADGLGLRPLTVKEDGNEAFKVVFSPLRSKDGYVLEGKL